MYVKCRYCQKKDTDRKDMTKEGIGYYHPLCFEVYKQEQAKKDDMVGCRMCKGREKYDKNIMVYLEDGFPKTRHGWYHPECADRLAQEQKKKNEVKSKKDSLANLIKDIHGVPTTPDWLWIRFDGLYEGQKVDGVKKAPKIPIDYPVIEEAYKIARRDIEWAIQNKGFDSADKEMKYAFAIAMGKINDAYRKIKHANRQEVTHEATKEIMRNAVKPNPNRKKYQEKKRQDDITEFLD